eukprot:CAMPEP_0182528194 /NCGR_PEP_ID=MMETSP1323-20130603/4356_1 /TAXON_ID=236787 /ORGANISM="Florenciella parvula, Strain RCC1693" /LENGTH=99 /DNA_ID=CAMNT_0024737285 /DNA_START=96 /DNA_END=394 /DNA_ORIENTATION=-
MAVVAASHETDALADLAAAAAKFAVEAHTARADAANVVGAFIPPTRERRAEDEEAPAAPGAALGVVTRKLARVLVGDGRLEAADIGGLNDGWSSIVTAD